eukprot:Transcript_5305.p1 GENE.Transcript_5305~~Transcript_5305.p1  ORF type:complete len:594 (-),score=105.09 Transcript_5305:42-1823(-)
MLVLHAAHGAASSSRHQRDSSSSRLTPDEGESSAWPAKPDVLLWLVDDQGFGNAGFLNDNVITPQMDQLARHDGAILMRHYTAPWCVPSRAALMTGIMPHVGLQGSGQHIPQSVRMLPQVMKAAGYSTHHIGKWHLGQLRSWKYPTSRGFDTSLGYMDGACDYVSQKVGGKPDGQAGASDRAAWSCVGVDLQQDGAPALGRNGSFSSHWIHEELTRTLNRSTAGPPLFLYVALQMMHTPSPGPEVLASAMGEYEAAGIVDKKFAEANALITVADHLLAHAVELLHATERWDTTLLVHLSDNGGQVTDPYGKNTWGSGSPPSWSTQGNNWPLRGVKRSYFEGGVRVPAFVSGGALPSAMRGKMLYGLVHIADWFSTIAELAGSEETPSRRGDDAEEQSMSMANFLAGGGSWRSRMVLGAGDTSGTVNYNEAVINGSWKLINGSVPCHWATRQGPLFPNLTTSNASARSRWRLPGASHLVGTGDCVFNRTTFLFNIVDDEGEHHNLVDDNPEQVALLLEMLAKARVSAEGAFERDPDRGAPGKMEYCVEYRDAHGGFLGPYMDGRQVHVFTEEEKRPGRRHPLAFAEPDVYTDEW